MSANDIVSELVVYNSCVLDTSYSLLDLNNDNNLTDVTKYQNFNSGTKVWFYSVNNGTHTWFDQAPFGVDDFWASEEIWSFFSQLGSSTTNLNNENHKANNRSLIKIVDVFGREIEEKLNISLFYIYDDGTVEKKLFLNK